ncbi:MAG: hypothetical protein KF729_11555 [Sandaracinaceae bacterium]|nr:hypothetical protein [Sandaracinaceae bacterium]
MVDPNAVLAGRTRETRIRRDDAGRWFDGEDPITHPLLTRAFDAWLLPAPDGSGRWCLSNDINWAFVALEGPPRFVRSLDADGAQIVLHLSDDTRAPLAPETLRQGPDGALYCDVRGLVARFDRHAAMQLAERLGEDERGVYLEVGGARVRPPTVDDPLAVR